MQRLTDLGRHVVATDLDTPANRKKAAKLPDGAEARWADLTDPGQVERLVAEVSPQAIIHLAAVIPPPIYRNAKLARRVNVDATATLVRIAEAQPTPPRWVQASSNAVFGSRNPHRSPEGVRADMPMRASDLYSAHKIEAEEIVRASSLDWVVLRLGGVLSVDPSAMPLTTDALYFESALPTDCRMHSVDVRDVAWAFAAATTADVVGEILLIAGDDTHKIKYGDVGPALAAARGLKAGCRRAGRATLTMTTTGSSPTGWTPPEPRKPCSFSTIRGTTCSPRCGPTPAGRAIYCHSFAPLVRMILKRRGAYWKAPGQYADPWGAIRAKLGEPAPDKPYERT